MNYYLKEECIENGYLFWRIWKIDDNSWQVLKKSAKYNSRDIISWDYVVEEVNWRELKKDLEFNILTEKEAFIELL